MIALQIAYAIGVCVFTLGTVGFLGIQLVWLVRGE